MKHNLTPLQKKCLDYIKCYISENDISPSYLEIKDQIGLSSKSQVSIVVDALIERGHITKLYHRPRSIALVEDAHPASPLTKMYECAKCGDVAIVPFMGRVS